MAFSILSLDQSHDLKSFNCGNTALNTWLQNTSRQHQKKNISRTFVLVQDESPATILGYYALAIRGLTMTEALPQNMKKSLPLNVPTMTLARLAVSIKEQRKGHGERLCPLWICSSPQRPAYSGHAYRENPITLCRAHRVPFINTNRSGCF